MKKFFAAAVAAVCFASSANAATSLVVNGGFEDTTNGAGQMNQSGSGKTDAVGWYTTGYNFIMNSSVDTTGVIGQYGFLGLWGPGNGAANGLSPSPYGGNFIGADGAYGVAGISQLITGLVVGKQYQVTFDWAGAQQYGYSGSNTEQWEVDLGSQKQFTSVVNNTSQGFSGWMQSTVNFTATSSSDVLTFIAHGTPNGVPPFSLLDGVSMTPAPEPEAWAMMVLGFGALGVAMRRRQKQAIAFAAA